jgi:hypothetical protein
MMKITLEVDPITGTHVLSMGLRLFEEWSKDKKALGISREFRKQVEEARRKDPDWILWNKTGMTRDTIADHVGSNLDGYLIQLDDGSFDLDWDEMTYDSL